MSLMKPMVTQIMNNLMIFQPIVFLICILVLKFLLARLLLACYNFCINSKGLSNRLVWLRL